VREETASIDACCAKIRLKTVVPLMFEDHQDSILRSIESSFLQRSVSAPPIAENVRRLVFVPKFGLFSVVSHGF